MSEKEKPEATVRVEIIGPPARRSPADAAAALKKLITEEVGRVMANRDANLFQPFFQEKRISDEIRRCQSVPEQRKWSIYYEQFGCLVCRDTKRGHIACGMCGSCHSRTVARLKAIIRKYGRQANEPQDLVVDRADMARQALTGPVRKALPEAPGSRKNRPKRAKGR